MFDSTTGDIVGISKSFCTYFGLETSMIKVNLNSQVKVNHICPDLLNESVLRDLLVSDKGALITVDTTSLKNI